VGVDGGVPARAGVGLASAERAIPPSCTMRIHPSDAFLQEAQRPSGKALERLLEHISGCVRCRERLDRLRSTDQRNRWSTERGDYGPALDRSFDAFQLRQAALERERTEAPSLLDYLVTLVPGQQQLFLKNGSRFRTWGVLELLLQRGREETFTDPQHAEELLLLALEVSAHLPRASYGRALIEDIRARAWGYIANSRRCRMELEASEEGFEEAFSRLPSGTEDPLERAILFDLKASLRRVQQRFEESLQLSSRAIAILRMAKQVNLLGKALINSSISHTDLGDPGQAASVLYQSLHIIDQHRDPRLALCALNNLVEALSYGGRFMESRRMLIYSRSVYAQFPDPRVQGRRLWAEAKVAWGLGYFQGAETLLQEARDRFISSGALHELGLISKDWAEFILSTDEHENRS
jgi:tetratricopeptide (TPR) repeat protein